MDDLERVDSGVVVWGCIIVVVYLIIGGVVASPHSSITKKSLRE